MENIHYIKNHFSDGRLQHHPAELYHTRKDHKINAVAMIYNLIKNILDYPSKECNILLL